MYATNKKIEDQFRRGLPTYKRDFDFHIDPILSSVTFAKIKDRNVNFVYLSYKSQEAKQLKKATKESKRKEIQKALNDL